MRSSSPSAARIAWPLGLVLALGGCRDDGEPGAGKRDATTPGDCAPPTGPDGYDAWGGLSGLSFEATGLFRVDQSCGRDWIIDPLGHPLRSLGVNSLGPSGSAGQVSGRAVYAETVAANYADDAAWAATAAERARSWGLNTGGSWSDHALLIPAGLAVTPILYLSGGDWQTGTVADWWDPAWEATVEANVAASVTRGWASRRSWAGSWTTRCAGARTGAGPRP